MAKGNLLVVDADPRTLRVLEVSLRKAGYNVVTAANAVNAVQQIERAEPDLVIAETLLPSKDGFALAAELRASPTTAHIPLLFLSSDTSEASKLRGRSLGAADYLEKPVYIRDILAKVSSLLESRPRDEGNRSEKSQLTGSLRAMGLIDLLQTIEVSRKSGILSLASGARRGSLFFQEGRVLDAELGKLSGEAAVFRFLLWSEGTFELEVREVRREDKLGISTQALLMEGVRRLDEWGRLREQLPGLHAILEVDDAELMARIDDIPDELNDVLRVIDGQRDIAEILEAAGGDDLVVLTGLRKLLAEGFVNVRARPSTVGEDGASREAPRAPEASELAPSPSVELPPLTGSLPQTLERGELGVATGVFERAEEGGRASVVPPRPAVVETPITSAGRVPLAVVQLKRVSAIQELNTLRPQALSHDIVPDVVEEPSEPREVPQLSLGSEGKDEMMKRGKRKSERKEERGGGTVIQLHTVRGDASGPERDSAHDLRGAGAPDTSHAHHGSHEQAARSAEQLASHGGELHHEDEHPDIEQFFAEPKPEPYVEHSFDDLGPVEHDPVHHYSHRRGMVWTAVIAGVGLLSIGGFLVYHKVLMPTPEELGPTPVSLPTPGFVAAPVYEPESDPGTEASGAPAEESQAPAPTPALPVPGAVQPSEAGAQAGAPTRPSSAATPPAPAAATPAATSAAPSTAPALGASAATKPPAVATKPAPSARPPSGAPSARPPSGAPAGSPPAAGADVAPTGAAASAAPRAEPAVEPPAEPQAEPVGGAAVAQPTETAPEAAPAAAEPTSAAPAAEVTPGEAAPGEAAPAEPATEAAAAAPATPGEARGEYAQLLADARKLGFRRTAEERYLAALAVLPTGTEALSGLAMLYLNLGKNADAKQRAQQALASSAENDEAWIVLGAAESALGNAREAREAYTRCAALPGKHGAECKRLLH